MLIQAWVNTSLDASIGTDQSANCYWVRISEYYNMHKEPSWPERNQNEVFRVCTDSLEKEQRPRGTKFDKEQKGKTQASDGVKLSLESVWAQKIEKDDIKEAAKSARYAQAFALQKKQIELQEREDARKQFELEEKIMFMDTSRMSDAQKKFYEDKQEEIVARRHHTSG